jgi:hypothetical protein
MTDTDRIDRAARAILARRATQPAEPWEIARTIADPDDVDAINVRLLDHARQIREGRTPTAAERG